MGIVKRRGGVLQLARMSRIIREKSDWSVLVVSLALMLI